jgi:hypothetical protein
MEHVFHRGFPWMGRPVVTMTVGQPFSLSDITSEPITAANRAYVTERVMARIVELLPTQYGGQAQPVLGHL